MNFSDEEQQKLSQFEESLAMKSLQSPNLFNSKIITTINNSILLGGLTRIEIIGSKVGFRFDDNQIELFVESLSKASIQLQDLSLPFHNITDVGMLKLSQLFVIDIDSYDSVQKMDGLNLEGNDITGSCLPRTKLTSTYECPILYLNLSKNPLSKYGKQNIAEILLKNRRIQELYINNCGFDLNAMVAIINNLAISPSLRVLHVDRPLLGDYVRQEEIGDHVSRALIDSQSIQSLSLKYSNILDLGAKLISDSLLISGSMLSLNLECNNIGVSGTEALASYLLARPNDSLKHLFLSYNSMSDDGAIALAEALKSNTCLTRISMKNNKIGNIGLQAIGKALEKNQYLESISIFGNEFNNANGKQYLDLIDNRFAFTGLYIDIDVYVVDGVYMIAEN
eukprot:gene9523-12828_t